MSVPDKALVIGDRSSVRAMSLVVVLDACNRKVVPAVLVPAVVREDLHRVQRLVTFDRVVNVRRTMLR